MIRDEIVRLLPAHHTQVLKGQRLFLHEMKSFLKVLQAKFRSYINWHLSLKGLHGYAPGIW